MRNLRILVVLLVCVALMAVGGIAVAQGPGEDEPNDRFGDATPIALGTTLQARIAPAGDRDWFVFPVDHHGELQITIGDVAAELAISVRVWNANRDTLSGWYAPLAPGGDTNATVDLLAPGLYYLEIAGGDGSQTAEQPYSLRVDFRRSPDQNEPNGSFGAATLLAFDQPTAATLLPAGDRDWLAVDVDHHGELRVTIAAVPATMVVSARVWNANRDTISGWYNPLAAGGDTNVLVDVPAPGRYYLELAGGDGSQRSVEAFSVLATFTPSPDQSEPNNSFGASALLGIGQPLAATILPAGDRDWFAFDVDHHGELQVAITGVPAGLTISVRVWNSNRDTISGWFNPLAAGGDTNAVVDLGSAGRYYLEIAAADGSQRSVDAYTLQADFTPAADSFEPNNSFGQASAFALNRSALINLLPGGDRDWFAFEAGQQGEWILQALDVPANLAVSLRVWNSNRDTITGWFSPLATGGETNALVDIGAPGRYFVEIAAGDGSQRSIEPFFFKNSFTPAADISEPNNDFESAAPIGLDETVPGNILPAGDRDWCIFDVETQGDLHIVVVNASPELTINLRLWNSAKQPISGWFSPLAQGGNVEAVVPIAEAGTYYLEIADNRGSARSIEPYYLRLSMAPIAIEDVTPPQPQEAVAEPAAEDGQVLVQTSATVGPAGATLIVNGTDDYEIDGARLQIPVDALEEPTTVSVGTAAEAESDAPFGLFPAGPFWRMQPAGLSFNQPVSLTLPLPPGAEAGDEYFVAHWNGTAWVDLGGAIENETITVQTDGFSTFGVFCGAFSQYRSVALVNDSSTPELIVTYVSGPAPIPDDSATQYATNCRPPVGNSGQLRIAQGRSASLLLRAGAYHFSVAYPQPQPGVANSLFVAMPSAGGNQTISISDSGAASDDASTQIEFAGREATAATNTRPIIACTAAVPGGVTLASLDPASPQLPSRVVRIGPLREDHLPPINLEFGLTAAVNDPEGSLIRPYWTFGQPGSLPVVGQPVASGSSLGDEIDFSPKKAGVYRIYLTVYDEANLFDECRWDIVVEPNAKPAINVFSGRTHVAFGRLDSDRATAGPIPFVAAPGAPPSFGVPSAIAGAPAVVGNSNTFCPSALLGPFGSIPEPETLVPAPAPVDLMLPAAGADATPRWPYPGRTCVWATPADADLDAQFVRWEFPLPYFGAGTFYAAIAVPAGFHPDAADGIGIGVLLRTNKQLNAYNAYVSTLYNTLGIVPAILWEAWDDPCLTADGGPPQNPCVTGLSRGGVTNLVAHTTDGFDKEKLGYAPISVGPEGFEPECEHVFSLNLTPMPSNPGPGQDVIVKARVSPIIQNCPVFFTIVGTDGYANNAVIRTNKDGEARFSIPGAVGGTVDVVTAAVVKEDNFGVVDTETEVIQMEVSYEF